MEQEIFYFIEKLDINEEIVRLKSNLKYFEKIMREKSPNGKKLTFISQEIGREINTLGSKSNDEKFKNVVEMKDELEKIKEQLLNVLKNEWETYCFFCTLRSWKNINYKVFIG